MNKYVPKIIRGLHSDYISIIRFNSTQNTTGKYKIHTNNSGTTSADNTTSGSDSIHANNSGSDSTHDTTSGSNIIHINNSSTNRTQIRPVAQTAFTTLTFAYIVLTLTTGAHMVLQTPPAAQTVIII